MSTTYPASLDSYGTKTGADHFLAEYMNDPQAALVAIQTELGTLPKGIHADVKARLVALEAITNTLDESYDEGGAGAGRTITVDSGAVLLVGANEVLNLSSNIWRLGGVVFDLDFTGTDYDTDGEVQAAGIKLSDVDAPIPDNLAWPVSGTWSHSASNGWLPAFTDDEQGPAMIIPLCRPDNWQISAVITYSAANVSDKFAFTLGYIANTCHIIARGQLRDADGSNTETIASLATNDADDTYTTQYNGSELAGTGDRELIFRCKNGTVSIYDDEDDSWFNYTGRQSAGHTGLGYSGAYAFLQFYKYAGVVFGLTYLKSLSLTYVL